MIPRISLMLLLASSTVALAQPLYKWVESDGSITFSPHPPGDGISHERVDPASPAVAGTDGLSPLATGDSQSPPTVPSSSAASPAGPLPRIEYAPGNVGDLPEAISRSHQEAARGAAQGASLSPVSSALALSQSRDNTAQSEQSDAGLAASISAASFKRSRCQDLRKRVTSLERRLQSRLTPEDMDNTVIHMARYQRSFDQYCAQ